jgi:hypothetical protein
MLGLCQRIGMIHTEHGDDALRQSSRTRKSISDLDKALRHCRRSILSHCMTVNGGYVDQRHNGACYLAKWCLRNHAISRRDSPAQLDRSLSTLQDDCSRW